MESQGADLSEVKVRGTEVRADRSAAGSCRILGSPAFRSRPWPTCCTTVCRTYTKRPDPDTVAVPSLSSAQIMVHRASEYPTCACELLGCFSYWLRTEQKLRTSESSLMQQLLFIGALVEGKDTQIEEDDGEKDAYRRMRMSAFLLGPANEDTVSGASRHCKPNPSITHACCLGKTEPIRSAG